jgi:micrococcal nuclease
VLVAAAAPSPAFAEDGGGSRAATDDCARIGSESATVFEIVDGDTLVLADGRVLRLAGVEAPKTYLARPGAEIEAVAVAARRALERLAGGKRVAIRPVEPARDRHGRIRAELTLEDGTWLQQAMVERGFVRVRPFAGEDSCLDALRAGEREAREARRGLWRDAEFSVVSAYDPSLIERNGLYVVVEGRVISVGHGDRVDFLNFGHVWRRDFTVLVGATAARRLAESGRSTDTMIGKRVQVRGIMEESGGPAIRLSDPGEIEILGEE